MTSRPHDALFKAAFETPEHATALFQLVLPNEVSAAISWSSIARESGTFIDPELADRHSDLLFSVQLADAPALLYLLLEHQSTHAHDMPLRMAEYLMRVWRRHQKEHDMPLPLILPAVVSHAPGSWTGPRSLHALIQPPPTSISGLAPLVLDYSMLVLDLIEADDAKLRDWALGAFPKLALVVLRDGRDPQRLRRDFNHWRDTFREVLRAPNGAEAVTQVLRYVALVTGDMHFEEFRATIREQLPEAGEIAMTIAEQLRQEGLQQGLQQGRQQERAAVLLKQLTLKFGSLPPACVTRIEAASYEQLERYIERVLTAESLEDLFAD